MIIIAAMGVCTFCFVAAVRKTIASNFLFSHHHKHHRNARIRRIIPQLLLYTKYYSIMGCSLTDRTHAERLGRPLTSAQADAAATAAAAAAATASSAAVATAAASAVAVALFVVLVFGRWETHRRTGWTGYLAVRGNLL